VSLTKPEVNTEFLGVATDFAPSRLPLGLFQQDQGGDRFKIGSWKRRRGMRRSDVATRSSAIVTLIGFEVSGGDFALLEVEGVNVQGATNVAQQ
jgi:hypothetical protein